MPIRTILPDGKIIDAFAEYNNSPEPVSLFPYRLPTVVSWESGGYVVRTTHAATPMRVVQEIVNGQTVVRHNLYEPGYVASYRSHSDIPVYYGSPEDRPERTEAQAIACRLDVSGSTVVDADDILVFISIWETAGRGSCCLARPFHCPCDWNSSGAVDVDDIFAYVSDWTAFGPGQPCP